MPFRKMLVAVDGSEYSQIAADYAFWLSNELDAEVAGQHVVDPRIVELFIAPEFGEELGFSTATDTEEKIFRAVEKIGKVILDLFAREAKNKGLKVDTFLDVGHIVDEVVKRSERFDLLILGHRGKGHRETPSNLIIGSVAERIVTMAEGPVFIAVDPPDKVEQFLVAFDGSEASKGALLVAERMAVETRKKLQALTVVSDAKHKAEAEYIIEQSEPFLKTYPEKDVFLTKEGPHTETLVDYAKETNSVLVMGAYGFNRAEEATLGSTALNVIRKASTSTLVYKHHSLSKSKDSKKAAAAKSAG